MNVYYQESAPFLDILIYNGYGYVYIYKSSKNYFHFLFYDNMEIIYSHILV
jgi:hypothetical protein